MDKLSDHSLKLIDATGAQMKNHVVTRGKYHLLAPWLIQERAESHPRSQ